MKQKHKARRLSIRWQILLPVTLVFIIGCANVGYNAVNSYNEELKNTAINQAESACNIAVYTVNPEELKLLQPGDETSDVYTKNLNALTEIAENCNIKYLYTIHEENGSLYYGLDIDTTESKSFIGKEYTDDTYDVLAPVLDGETVKSTDIDVTEYGDNLLTVYKPIYDSSGKIIAIMGCDYDATHVIDSRNSIISKLVMVLIATLLFDITLINFIVGKTMKNINMVESTLYDLVHKDGDLTQKLEITTGDECELIADNINNLLEHIREIVTNIAQNSLSLGISSEEVEKNVNSAEDKLSTITAVLEELSASTQETAASLNQVNENISNITISVDSISDEAYKGSESSKTVMTEAETTYKKAVSERAQVLSQSQEIANSVMNKIKKSKSVEKINALTEEIIEITEQTNLLSLNASIEAARAGEFGRGFAVVADEIGKLANNSSKAAIEIKKVNEEVLDAVNELAKEAEEMLSFIEAVTLNGYDSLLDTSKNYEENISKLNNILLDFSDKCSLLKANITDISETANAVNIAIEENAQGISHIAENSVELKQEMTDISEQAGDNKNISKNLSKEVNKFKYE